MVELFYNTSYIKNSSANSTDELSIKIFQNLPEEVTNIFVSLIKSFFKNDVFVILFYTKSDKTVIIFNCKSITLLPALFQSNKN